MMEKFNRRTDSSELGFRDPIPAPTGEPSSIFWPATKVAFLQPRTHLAHPTACCNLVASLTPGGSLPGLLTGFEFFLAPRLVEFVLSLGHIGLLAKSETMEETSPAPRLHSPCEFLGSASSSPCWTRYPCDSRHCSAEFLYRWPAPHRHQLAARSPEAARRLTCSGKRNAVLRRTFPPGNFVVYDALSALDQCIGSGRGGANLFRF